jgi:hemoglobin
MTDLKDIENRDDIEVLVNAFYSAVKKDALLAPVFASRIADDAWPAHLQRMYNFWSALLLGERGFEGNPMQKHFSLPIDEGHFTRWLQVFNYAVDRLFTGPKADEAKKRSSSIAQIMQFKIASLH